MGLSGAAPTTVDGVLRVLARPDDDLRDLLRLAAKLCDAEAAGVTVPRSDLLHVPLTFGLEPFDCPLDDTFCATVMDRDEVVVVPDAREDPQYRSISWVDGTRAAARFYASAPLHSPTGDSVGRLCVIASRPHDLGKMQRRSLSTLAASVTQLIELRLRREADPRLEHAGDEAAATVVTQIAAELSHDMRVPLAAITAGVELLDDQLDGHRTPTVETLLGRIRSSSDRLLRMLEQNLDLDVADTRRSSTDVDLGLVLEQVVAGSAHLLDPAGAVVEARNLPVVRADADAMYSVLQNLLSNAVKFRRPDVAPWVRVSARRRERGWRVAVRDNGVGIADDRRDQVFGLFQRGDHEVAGHGIGLATVARLVRAHGGQVGIDSVPEGGTEVWFELPDGPVDPDLRLPSPRLGG